MLTILTGLSGSGKTKTICEEIRDNMASRTNMVLLTPEQQSHRAERRLAAVCGPALSLRAEVLSFTRMASRAALELGGLADPIPDAGGRLLLMARAVAELGPKLRRFGEQDRRADFLPRLMATAEEFRGALLKPEAVEAAAERIGGGTGEKLRDMALLLSAWDAVTEKQLGDSRDAVMRLADGIEKTKVGAGGVWVDGFTDFTAAELRVLEGILARGTDLTVALTLGEGRDEERFRIPERTAQALAEMASRRGAALRFRRLPDPDITPLSYLAENLFAYHAAPLKTEGTPVELCRMTSFPEECRWAASRILALLREDETLRFRDIAVAVPDFASRRGAAEAVFKEYGIPVFVEETDSILNEGLVSCVTSALKAVTEGWRFGDVFRCLKTGYGGLSPEETDELENYCLTWDIRGESMWRRAEDWDLRPGGYGKLSERDRADLLRLNTLRRKAAAPLGRLADVLKTPAPVREYLRAAYGYLADTAAAETLRAETEAAENAGKSGEASANVRLWAALMDAFSQMDTVLGGVTVSAAEFRKLLELLLGQRKVGAIPAALDAAGLGSPARLRGQKPRILIILGADDESLPARPSASGLFSAEEKRGLLEQGLKLMQDRDEEVCRPLLEVYLLAASAREKLLVSYTGGEESRESLLFRRARALLNAPLVTGDTLRGGHLTSTKETCLRLAFRGSGPWAEAAKQVLQADALSDFQRRAMQERGSLSPESVTALYGHTFRLTASRAETYHQCAYLYFLQYGLGAKERKFAGFNAPESGTFIHYVLESVCREVMAAGGFRSVTEETLRSLTKKYTEAFAAETFRASQTADKRFLYLFRRLCLTAETIVLDVAGELAAGEFEPLDFELKFGPGEDAALPPVQVADIRLSGTVDRVDGWTDGEKLYLCVADYKTGRKSFSLTDVWYGLGIQMLIYLFMLEERGGERYGKEIVPAGVLYAPARDVLLNLPRSTSAEEAARKRADALRRSGLLLADDRLLQARESGETPRYLPVKYKDGEASGSIATAAQLGELAAYVKKLLRKMSGALRQGNAVANPLYKNKTEGPCVWCAYKSVCGFDPEREEPRMERKRKDAEFWTDVEEEVSHGGF